MEHFKIDFMRATRSCPLAIILAVSAATLSALAQSASHDQLQKLFQQGAAQMHAGDAASAEKTFRKATEIDPQFAPAYLDLGLAALKQGKLLDAVASIRRSLDIDPSSPGAHLFLGIAEYQSNHTEDAIADLQKALQADPGNVQALTWMGIVQLNAGHPELATGPLDHAAELAPADQNILDYHVQAHMAVARQSYTALYKADPNSWRLHRLNAAIDAQASDHAHAAEEYQEAIKSAPHEPELYEGLGWEYRALGHADLAAKAFAQQLKLTPGNPIAMYNLGSAQVDSGQEEVAIPLLQQVVKIYEQPSGADYYLGRALAQQGKYEEAVAELQRATILNGEVQQRAWYELSQAYRHLGKTTESRAAVQKFEALKQAGDEARSAAAEDWRKLDAANSAPPSEKVQQ
jgi:tetratricopeptide (TPR) repeat protein